MDNLLKFTNFLLEKGCNLIGQNDKLRVTKYEKDGIFIRITQDSNLKRFIEISRSNDHSWKGWYSLDIVRFFILKEHYVADGIIEFEQLSQFFIENYDQILEACLPANFPQAEIAMTALKFERKKVLFG